MRASVAAEALRRAGRVAMRVYGASMVGAIWPGDVVVFEACALDALRAGDIVLYRRDECLVAHRVIENSHANGGALITRGDALRGNDLPVCAEDVLGRAILLQPERGMARALTGCRSTIQKTISWMAARSSVACEVALRLRALYLRAGVRRDSHGAALEISH